ncbi:hypothetical protein B0H19DRAFT_591541 [Mycena capillaripes]|nr:hypothetical protein B0H19DRAFT_591541 [Mycena capillaripes]
MRLPHSFVALLFAVLASGAVTNNTFDDSNSSFKFVGNWAALSTSSPCSTLNCPAQPDTSQIHEGTWHVGTIHNGDHPYTTIVGSFTFKGSAVYIFGIDQAGVQAEIWFALDGNNNAAQKHHYTGTEKFSYNALFFSATGLSTDIMHTVGWGLAPAGPLPAQGQVALFDYAIVTSEEEDTSTPPIGASTDAGAGGGTAGTST